MLGENEANKWVMTIRLSGVCEYPTNLLTREETKFCIQHVEELADMESSPQHEDYGDLGYLFAKLKLAADYYGISYNMPGRGEERYRELRLYTGSGVSRLFKQLFQRLF